MKYFQLTKNEQYGILGLLIILGCLLGVKYYSLQLSFSVQKTSIVKDVKEDLKTFHKEDVKYSPTRVEKKSHPFFIVDSLKVKRKFDPNKFEVMDWLNLGLPSSIAERTFKYIKLNGGVDSASSLLNVYGFKETWYTQIKDSVFIPTLCISINSATVVDFERIKGIGQVLSKRVINYRDYLGGFVSIDQLKQVYGIDSSIIVDNIKNFKVDLENVDQININTSSFNFMVAKPYISKKAAKNLLIMRANKKLDFNSIIDVFGEIYWFKHKHYFKW